MKLILKIFIGLIAFICILTLGTFTLSYLGEDSQTNPIDEFINDTTNSLTNAAIDTVGIKTYIESTLLDQVDTLSAATGLSTSEVTAFVSSLDIENWETTTLPTDAIEASSTTSSYGGIEGTITTYEDSEFVSLEIMGQEVTFEVPENAQEYVKLLNYL